MSTPIPPPHEPIVDDGKKANEVWYRYWEDNSRGLESAESAVSAMATTYAQTILDSTAASVARTALGLGTAATEASSVFSVNSGTPVATTGTTAVSLTTGIPVGVTDVRVVLNGVSLNTVDPFHIQLGTTSGLSTTGYSGGVLIMTSGGTGSLTSTFSFPINANTSVRLVNGSVLLSRLTSHTWVASYCLTSAVGSTAVSWNGGGSVSLGAAIDRISLLTTSTGVFRAGEANVFWEF